ncbi:DedA family protein [Ponticoccus litoralis]|uniref:VTT domain-containing protein n=1 Tax=Ponticoccus litoralis TaxID=422297 RepID=A0AAW9SSQ3_9RHOB
MSPDVVQLLADYGLWAIAIATFTSCLAAPVPSTFLMLAGGAFAAAGDMSLTAICVTAYLGALLGDQVGYFIGRRGGSGLVARLRARPKIGRSVGRAQDAVARWGAIAVFLSRWLVAPLGPYANLIAGAGGLARAKFTLGSVSGEVIWVGMYVSLGYFFSAEIAEIAELAQEFGGLVAGGVVAAFLGWLLFRRRAAERAAAE